ncbi:UNVERIFIED_CONTAM: hypothetical protein FKN15_030505 [Acipenser sinensis]
MESDGTSPAVKLFLSAELIPLIKRATATLQVPWPTEGKTRQSIFDDKPTDTPISPQFTWIFYMKSSLPGTIQQQLLLFPARVPDGDKALLDALVTPGHLFGPVVYEMLQCSHHTQESAKELVCLLPKQPPLARKSAANWCPRAQHPPKPAQPVVCPLPVVMLRTSPCLLAVEVIISSAALHKNRSRRRNSGPRSLLPQAQAPFSWSHLEYWRQCTTDIWVLTNVQTSCPL